jgi:hypothetical protein
MQKTDTPLEVNDLMVAIVAYHCPECGQEWDCVAYTDDYDLVLGFEPLPVIEPAEWVRRGHRHSDSLIHPSDCGGRLIFALEPVDGA